MYSRTRLNVTFVHAMPLLVNSFSANRPIFRYRNNARSDGAETRKKTIILVEFALSSVPFSAVVTDGNGYWSDQGSVSDII
jgi:hypothetical protein